MDKYVRGLFCGLLFLLIILSSYKIIMFSSSYTVEQEKWMSYFSGGERVEGNYTTLEVSHMEDVNRVIKVVNYVFYLCLILVIVLVIYYKKELDELIYYGGLVSIFGGILFLLVILISFNFTFSLFHKIFFPQGNWIFAADSLLIQTFPLEFFIGLSVRIFLLALVMGTSLGGIGYYWKRKEGGK